MTTRLGDGSVPRWQLDGKHATRRSASSPPPLLHRQHNLLQQANAGATDLGAAPDISAAYSATVTSPTTVVPEPSTLPLLITALGGGLS
jgi:hypothetical protein